MNKDTLRDQNEGLLIKRAMCTCGVEGPGRQKARRVEGQEGSREVAENRAEGEISKDAGTGSN